MKRKYGITKCLYNGENQYIVSINRWLQGSFESEIKANSYIEYLKSEIQGRKHD